MSEPMVTAVTQAKWAYEHKDSMDKQTRVDHARALGAWGCFSNRQISAFTGLNAHDVAFLTEKSDRTGGNLDPEALGDVLEVIHIHARGEEDYFATKRALDAGVSGRMLARLTGRAQVTLARHARRAADMLEGKAAA